jgi:putative transposase
MRSYNRKTIRLENYDYSQANLYFLTVCTLNRECIFGQMQKCRDGVSPFPFIFELNRQGEIVNNYWEEISKHFMNVETDEFIIMPSHIHGIIKINGKTDNVGAGSPRPLMDMDYKFNPNLGQVIAYFKYQSTKMINQISGTAGKQIWQRNYYEYIIRSEKDFQNIREYILFNLQKWESDLDNPNNSYIGRGDPAPT